MRRGLAAAASHTPSASARRRRAAQCSTPARPRVEVPEPGFHRGLSRESIFSRGPSHRHLKTMRARHAEQMMIGVRPA